MRQRNLEAAYKRNRAIDAGSPYSILYAQARPFEYIVHRRCDAPAVIEALKSAGGGLPARWLVAAFSFSVVLSL